MTRVHWMHIYKLPVLLEPLKYSLHHWVSRDSTIHSLPSHAILIATVTASLPEDQSARLFVNKADCFLQPGWTDPSQLLLDPCHSADKKIHTSGREDLLSADTTTIQTTQLAGEGRKGNGKTFGCVFLTFVHPGLTESHEFYTQPSASQPFITTLWLYHSLLWLKGTLKSYMCFKYCASVSEKLPPTPD